jgi:hypothetical protein
MKRFLFAVAVVALSACAGLAEDKPATSGTTTAPATPVITSATPVVEYAPAQTQRRGLFGRLRNRNTTTMSYSVPLTTPTMAPATPMPMPGTTTPQPMPGIKPAGGVSGMPGMVVQATGNLPPGQYTTTDGMIIQIGGTQPMTMPMTPTTTSRGGLFSRLRNR